MMNQFLYKNKKKITFLGILFLISGLFLAYLKWGIEPQETIAGFLCGLGFGISVLGFGLKNPENI